MALSRQQYQDIMQEYGQIRRENHLALQERREKVYAAAPRIRQLDEDIAHISIARARERVLGVSSPASPSLHAEILDLSMERINLLVLHGYPADYLDPIYRCALCKDTGYQGQEKCSCFKQRIFNLLCEQSNLSDRIKEENFSSFRADYYSDQYTGTSKISPRENIMKALAICQDFVRDFPSRHSSNLLIYGNTGVGKTFLSSCIANELLHRGYSVVYQTAYQFFSRLADHTFRREDHDEDILSPILDCDLLILDDLGTELTNAFTNSQLFLCINERILHKKSTIINTNLSFGQLSATYSERIASRIGESYVFLHIFGEDIRLKKAFSSLD